MTVRAAVIGCGLMGRRYLAVLRAATGVEIVGFADPEPQALEAGRRLAPAPGYADHRALLRAARPDAVFVCTPDQRHREPAVDAIAAGAAVLVEKPLATTEEDADVIQRAAAGAAAPVMVAHLLRFDGRYAAARRAVAAGEVGRVLHIRAYRSAAAADFKRRGGGVSVLWHLAVHDVDLVRWITGREVTAAAAAGVTDPAGVLLMAGAQLRLAGGALATVDVSAALPDAFAGRVWAGLTVTGTAGCLDVPSAHAAVAVHAGGGVAYTDPTRFVKPPGLPPQGALRDQIAAFLDAVRGRTAPPVPVSEGCRAVRVVAAVERALASGTWVPVAA